VWHRCSFISNYFDHLLWLPYVIGQAFIFLSCGFFFLFCLFPPVFSAVADWMSTILSHMVWLSANLGCRFETCCKRLSENTGRKNLPSGLHHTNLSGYIFATKARIDNRKKNLLNSNNSPTCPHNMVNFGPLVAEIFWRVWGITAIFNGSSVTARLSSGRQPNVAALNRGRHLYSAGWPSRWTSAHIVVIYH